MCTHSSIFRDVPAHLPQRNVREEAADVRGRFLLGLDRVEEQAHVRPVLKPA